MSDKDPYSWLDGNFTGLEQRADIMRTGSQDGKDRVWWCDGEYVWFRRAKSNPATLERHNRFVQDGDYQHVETQGDVEVWQLRPQSIFHSKDGPRGKTIDISRMNDYNLRRQAALAACRRDFEAFRDVMSFLRERMQAIHALNPNGAETAYAEQYLAVMASIEQRDGPSAGEINRELHSLKLRAGEGRERLISIG